MIVVTSIALLFVIILFGKTKLHKIWAVMNLVVAIWGAGSFLVGQADNPEAALFGWRVGLGGATLISVFFFHTICVFGNLKRRKTLFYAYSQAISFVILSITTDKVFTGFHLVFNSLYYNKANALYSMLYINWGIVAILGFYELYKIYIEGSGLKRAQALYMLIGFGTGFAGGALTLFPAFGISLYPVSNFSIPLYACIVTYAIFRYHLMDITIVFKKTAAYSLAAGILTSVFVVLVISMTKYLSDLVGITSLTITAAAAVTIAILFNPLRNRIQKIIDNIFYKKTYDYYAIIQQVSSTLTSMFDLNNIYKFIGNTIYEALGLKSVYLLAAVTGGDYNVVYHTLYKKEKSKKSEPEKEEGIRTIGCDGLNKFFSASNDILIKDELPRVEDIIGMPAAGQIKKELELFQGEAAMPVFVDNKPTLILIIGGKISGDVFTNEDINLLKTISDQTAIAVKNANLYKDKLYTEKLASIGMMSATFAHEVRNPLTSLKTFAQLMPEKYNDTEFRDIFSKIVVGEIEKIDGLISDLLDFSSKKKSTRMNNFNLTELLDGIVNHVKDKLEFEQSGITVEKNYNGSAVNMTGDAAKLKQAFGNIIINGCQAMHGEGTLKVDIKPANQNVEIVIADTGEGIHPDDVSKIFDPFVTTKERGVGLGLAISKRIIEDHNGDIQVQSQLSKGTVFTISLPVQNE
ncbi:MAG: hypothetical protein HZA14_04145 [Nitrospirae bacterium]|nr:hypothetical protein [Nitrospirota bacterium]